MTAAPAAVHPWAAEAARRVRFGVETAPFAPWAVLRAFAQAVDDLGFDSLWIPDHPMATGSATWTHLAAMAEATRRVRLGPRVACVPYANPLVTARAAADLDLISGGRALLGLGSGDAPWEFAQLGVPWRPAAPRQAALEAALQLIHPLLRGETVASADGPFRSRSWARWGSGGRRRSRPGARGGRPGRQLRRSRPATAAAPRTADLAVACGRFRAPADVARSESGRRDPDA